MNGNHPTTYPPSPADNWLIWIITLCSLRLFTFIIPMSIAKGVTLMGVLIVFGLLMVYIVYANDDGIRKRFRTEIVMIFIALIISAFAAEFFHEQSILTTLFSQYEFYVFIFYFLLHRMRPDSVKIVDMFVWLGYIYCFIYFLQYFAYPAKIVSSIIFNDRGTIRIFMPGSQYIFASWFILLSRYFISKKLINIIGLIPIFIVFILLGTRQVLATIILLTLLNILLSRSIKSKVTTYILIALMLIPFYFLFQGIFDQLFEVSKKAQNGMKDNIRIMAANYFLFDFNRNPLWLLTGNGMPGPHSHYGVFLSDISDKLGYYQSDIGIIGDLSKFGILFALAQLMFMIKMVFLKYSEKHAFIRYNAIAMILTMFTGAGLGSGIIVFSCLMFYIAEVDNSKPKARVA